ncbi:MAG: flagellar hook-basal body complex protein [Planctomycetota bacterium]
MSTRSLLTGASGLMAHQQKLDVVANNIANLNTTGYKTQRTLFSDLMYTDLAPAVGATGQQNGGVNPTQVGNGVQVASINHNFAQGVLADSGSEFDFALDGDGFFVVDKNGQQFTRDGSFSIDANGFLVDPANGGFVQRHGTVGETIGDDIGFQLAGDQRINVPLGATVPGEATTTASLFGNLPSNSLPALTEVLTTAAPLTAGAIPATLTTLINDLDINVSDYLAGDQIDISGTNADGSSFSTSLAAGPTTTLGDLTTAVNGVLTDASMTLSPTGNLQITADQPGDALLSLSLFDATGNTGDSSFEDASFLIETDGKDPDRFETTMQVFDGRGTPLIFNVAFDKTDFNRWNATFSGQDNVQFDDALVTEIVFTEQGGFQVVNGSGEGDSNIEFTVDSITGTQQVDLNFDNLTHLATNFTATYDQDGYAPGTIVAMEMASDGTMSGIVDNGQRLEVAQLAVARFANNQGLENIGENYFQRTASSGDPSIGAARENGRGFLRGGQLENSNVDVALEFTQLIIAQRGFSANARSITVATEVLQELNNIF